MMAAPATVIYVAGGASASSLHGSASSSPVSSPLPLASRLRGREPSDDDDEPLLGSPLSGSATSATASGSSRASVVVSVRRCLSRVTRIRAVGSLLAVLSLSGGATWIVKGLCVCLGMMLVGGVGSFTLHQLMSPQIESLLRQRSDMQLEMESLRNQVINQTRIAESRLEMIHVLEQELEKQVLAAAAAAAAAATANPDLGDGAGLAARPSPPFAAAGRHADFWTTLVYAALLGSIVLALVGLRVYQIARAETQRTHKTRASSDVDVQHNHVAVSFAGDEDDDAVRNGKPSSSAYKRAPLGGTLQDRLVHV